MPTTDQRQYMTTFRARQRQAGVRRVGVTLSSAEHKRVFESAASHSERITSHLKTLAMAQLDSRYLVPPDIAERLDSLLAIMRGIGNNLNQMARHSNEMKAFLEMNEVLPNLKKLDDSVRDFVGKPPKK